VAAHGSSPQRRQFLPGTVYSIRQVFYLLPGELRSIKKGAAMKNKFLILLLVMLCCSVLSAPLLAHHSSSAYDMKNPVDMKGVVTNMEWSNPHVFIYMNMKNDKGEVEEWRVEGNSPNMLFRAGWKKEMIKAGDELTVNGAPAKNGAKSLRLLSLTLANGQKYDGQGFK
jgi:hypothetical protein